MYYPGDSLRQASAEALFLKQSPIDSRRWCDFGCCTLHYIAVHKQTTADRHIAHLGDGGNPCNMKLCAAGFILSIMYMLATNYSILTSR
jgi:hypothetical protein